MPRRKHVSPDDIVIKLTEQDKRVLEEVEKLEPSMPRSLLVRLGMRIGLAQFLAIRRAALEKTSGAPRPRGRPLAARR